MSLGQASRPWQWSAIPEPAANARAQSIVAIHGLDGHRTATWTHSNANIFWLQDLLPGNVQNARIMTFGYDADVFFSRTTSDIDDHGSSLLANLIDVREANEVLI